MNREQRRRAARQQRRSVLEAVRATAEQHGACGDCPAELTLTDDGTGVVVAEVAHEPTCPALARAQGRR